MRYVSKLVLSISIALPLILAGCASAPKVKKKSAPVESPAKQECRKSCGVMAECSARAGHPWSHNDEMNCRTDCMQVDPRLRSAVAKCSAKVLSRSCNMLKMQCCVRSVLNPGAPVDPRCKKQH